MQKHVNLVDLVKGFPTNIYLQNLASIQKRTSPVKFAHLAEKSGKGSISDLSTKAITGFAFQEFVWGTPVVDQTPIFFTFFGDILAPGSTASLGLF